ncbi:MAG TPA: ABC transporter ATP-binding protein [Patescibacteria group bacterium]
MNREMAIKDNPIIFLSRKTWEFSRGNRSAVFLYVFLFILGNSVWLAEPLVIAKILNIVQEKGITQDSLPLIFLYLFLALLLPFGFWVFHGPARVIETRNAFLVKANYKKYLLEGTLALPAEWHADHHSGDTIDKIEKSSEALFEYSSDTFQVIETVINLTVAYIALTYFNPHSGYIVLALIVLTMFSITKFDQVLVAQYAKLFKIENKISAKIFDTISNIVTVISLRIEKMLTNAIVRQIMSPFKLFVSNRKMIEWKWFFVSVGGAVMAFLVIGSYIYFNVKEGAVVLVGTVYVLYGYVQRIQYIFFEFAHRYNTIVRQKTAVLNVGEITQEFKEVDKIGQIRLGKDWSELKIEDLKFSYQTDEGGRQHLDNISLAIKRHEKIALIGASGSGKTTLLKIIRDLYHPQKIKLYLDGKALKEGFRMISQEIALIPQDPEIFSTTIEENITFGIKHKFSLLKKFTDQARFTNVVQKLPKKFQSSVFEKGVNLSSGEKQRLALARGLLASQDKEIILMDEPTSSVDLKNELEIFQNIFREFKDKTIISSIHRLHLLKMFDHIYFFRDGKIIASGTFEELLKSSQEFEKIWEKYTKTKKFMV